MIEWANLEDLWWVLSIPLILVLLLIVQHRSEKVFHNWFNPAQYRKHNPISKYFLMAGAICLVGFSLLGPAWGNSNREVNIMGREIYFLLDISASMNCRDLKPSRLEKVKKELTQVIRQMRGDKMGLIVYTSQGFVQCPLTTDSKLLTLLLNMVETNQFSNTGTDLRAGLSKCLERFAAEPRIKGKKVSRAVVILTDGEDFGDKYTSVLLRLENQGVRVIPISVGSGSGAPVPLEAGSNQFYTDAGGQMAISKVNKETIQQISDQSGEEAFSINSSGENLSDLGLRLKNLPATLVDEREERSASNQYQWFLGLGILFCFVALYFTPVRR